ncbi:unnamed protein product [Fusarium graminearum]|nr:unnamed protein product [Fusarium graminearum]CAG1995933.1 unnamed protein product [Fusarium graminearum]VTO88498.1 unnamed protein product [Fusarium graminearum]
MWPENGIVHHEPSLFTEASQVLAVINTLPSANRREDVFHGSSAETGEKNDAKGDKVGIVVANAILSGLRVVVAKMEELLRVVASFGDESLGEEDESEKIERES